MCYEEITIECSKLGHKQIGRDYQKTDDCVRDSFTGSDMNNDDNTVFKTESEDWIKLGSAYWPSVVINDRTYRGDLVPDSVFAAICAGYSEEP